MVFHNKIDILLLSFYGWIELNTNKLSFVLSVPKLFNILFILVKFNFLL